MPRQGKVEPAPVQSGPWVVSKIKVKVYSSAGNPTGKENETSAKVYGTLAVHLGFGEEAGKYALTHLPTSLLVCHTAEEADALRIGELLWRRACLAFRETDGEALVAKLPKWVGPWCVKCREAGKYMEPPQ